ncbi:MULTISPECIES: hypothetical protein [unclassified Coleofasciculus]|uniref:hypothetical protein n=1 Tax=unclassified Coleofasciculus TaxID=2692782 RepID=UPI001882FEF1|nr:MULTISPECIES: hypothetical protein [unclassified Coleofasciculus]MBE9127096.1 hypothetical protein [Coleofasciculus sp. LEGE 07081]MBE9150418.1 hypothetical protein [Coleofasciculus sp. LEGE 07092]
MIGKPFWEARWWMISLQIQEQLQDAIARAKEGEFIRYEVEVQGAGDRWFWYFLQRLDSNP